ncbi:phosphatase PAP2 family protein, partial [Rouxiella sp. Mn2063]|uniref:phosphatase PAP2 family protein n=1 Tax=Rouxiella sp. Mn2063 TaxID=3395262 RepID=UPI003BE297BE
MSKLSSLALVLLGTCSPMIVTASDDSIITITKEQRKDWLTRLVNVLSTAPEYSDNSFAPKSDLKVSNEKRNYVVTDKKRYDLASEDQDENQPYLSNTFSQQGLNHYADRINVLDNEGLKNIYAYVKKGNSYIKDNGKSSSLSTYIKHLYKRVRPWDIVDENGEYKQNFNKYKDAKHSISSYPSGHTWRGFQNGLSYALAFPEIGDEFISRSLQFGESRVIVGAHFPTDTIASRISNYYLLSELLSDNQIVADIANNARIARDALKEECGDTVRNCLAFNKKVLYNQYKAENDRIGYYGITRQDMPATQLKVEDMPKESEALLRLRFPYLSAADRLSIIASTAYPNNSLAAWDASRTDNDRYWGLIDLPKAYNGPSYLYQDMYVNQVDSGDLDFANFGSFDTWNNAISGPGQLVKSGDGTLVLNGNDSFNGVTVNGGVLVVQGNSQYQGQSTVNDGHLVVNGTLGSDLDVNDKGILSGNGTLKNVNVNPGAQVAPGNSVGDLHITNNITFNPGSRYAVEVDNNGNSDRIQSAGTATLNGGNVTVSLENSSNLLSQSDVRSLLGQQYNILSAQQGVSGQFDSV